MTNENFQKAQELNNRIHELELIQVMLTKKKGDLRKEYQENFYLNWGLSLDRYGAYHSRITHDELNKNLTILAQAHLPKMIQELKDELNAL